jgi:hypothetical protein
VCITAEVAIALAFTSTIERPGIDFALACTFGFAVHRAGALDVHFARPFEVALGGRPTDTCGLQVNAGTFGSALGLELRLATGFGFDVDVTAIRDASSSRNRNEQTEQPKKDR